MALGDELPNVGTITVQWRVDVVDGDRRLGWSVKCDPPISDDLACLVLEDVVKVL